MAFQEDNFNPILFKDYLKNKEKFNQKYKSTIEANLDLKKNQSLVIYNWLLEQGNFRKLSDQNFSMIYIPLTDHSNKGWFSFLSNEESDNFIDHKKHLENLIQISNDNSIEENLKENYLSINRELNQHDNEFLICVNNCISESKLRKCFNNCSQNLLAKKNQTLELNIKY